MLLKISCFFVVGVVLKLPITFGLGEVGEIEVQKFNRIPMLKYSTNAPILANPL
jgi:hypothetical protein